MYAVLAIWQEGTFLDEILDLMSKWDTVFRIMAVVFMELTEEICALSLVWGSSRGIGLPEEFGPFELVENDGVSQSHLCKHARWLLIFGRFVSDVCPAVIRLLVGNISYARSASCGG